MSDFALSDIPGEGADRPPAERGTLEVRSRVVEHIACNAANGVPGTTAHTRGLAAMRSSYPAASVKLLGGRAWIELDVAAAWPCNAQQVATDVRDRVYADATALAATHIETVTVTLHLVDPDEANPTKRRVL